MGIAINPLKNFFFQFMEQKSLLLILHVCKSIEGRKEIDTILNKNGRYHLYFLKSSKTEFHCPSLFAQLPKDKKI